MMFSRRFAMYLLVVTCCLTWSLPAAAFVVLKDYSGNETSWSAGTIKWYLHPNGSADVSFSQLQTAMNGMFQEYKNVSCFSKSFSYGGTKSNDPEDGVYIKFMETSWDPTVGDAAAYAQSWKSWGGNITNAIIVYNGKDMVWTTTEADDYFSSKSDIQGVGTHELGHCLGLDHSRHMEATMFFTGGSAEMRSLEPDDKNGICYLYSSFSSGQPCDSCSSDNNCQSGYCLEYPGGGGFCGKNCTSDSSCPEHFYCYDITSGTDQCVATNGYCDQQGGNIPVGQFCYGHETCQSGLCLALPGNAYCSKECSLDSQCSGSMKCISGYCVQGGSTPIGGSCQTHMECTTSMCMGISATDGVCTQECAGGYDCPNSFSCVGGYCYKGGGKPYGEPCSSYDECESLYCKSPGAVAQSICTYECDSKYDCPGQNPCTYGLCIPPGPGGFGEKCEDHTDCQTGLCKGSGTKYCTMLCDSDSDCPQETTCQSGGYCSKPAVVVKFCGSDSDCGSGQFCKALSPSDATAVCVKECNPLTDAGCSSGWACSWFYKSWTNSIHGECVPGNNGGGPGDSCNPSSAPCAPNLVCINVGGTGPACHADCHSQSGQGCDPNQVCLTLGIQGDPHHGVCVCNGSSCGEEPGPDVTEQPVEDVVSQPDTPRTQPDGKGQADSYKPGQPDTGGSPQEDTDDFQWTWNPDQDSGSSGNSGCSHSTTPTGSNPMLIVLLLALLALRKRVRNPTHPCLYAA